MLPLQASYIQTRYRRLSRHFGPVHARTFSSNTTVANRLSHLVPSWVGSSISACSTGPVQLPRMTYSNTHTLTHPMHRYLHGRYAAFSLACTSPSPCHLTSPCRLSSLADPGQKREHEVTVALARSVCLSLSLSLSLSPHTQGAMVIEV